jgi:hypothetical protein
MTGSQDQRSLVLSLIVSEMVDLMHALMQNSDDADRAIVALVIRRPPFPSTIYGTLWTA